MTSRYQRFLFSLVIFCLLGVHPSGVVAQSTGTIKGRVTNAETGSPLPGANAVLKGTNTGTSANADGEYELRQVPAGKQTLVVSFVGYEKKETTVNVSEGQVTTANIQLSNEAVEAGEVVVTGIRESQARSVQQKKQAINVVDALSADDIGNLPEKNVAEAVQRLPGVLMTNDRTEGRLVSIRGGAAELNNVTLDGNSMASTTDSRATGLDLLPAEMVSNVEVTKAVTPDMPGNAVGGSVNIETLSAFDRQGSFLFGSLRGLNHDQQVADLRDQRGEEVPFRADLTGGTKFGSDNQFGVVLSASGSRRDFTTSGLKGEEWNWANDPDGSGPLPSTNVPEASEQIVESNRRQRFALSSSFDWRPSEETSVYVRPYFTYTDEEKIDNELEYVLGDFGASGGNPDQGVQQLSENKWRFPAGYGSVDLSLTDEEEQLWGTSAGLEHDFDNAVTVSASGSYSRGYLESGGPDGEFQTPGEDADSPSTANRNAAGVADMTDFLFDFFPENPQYIGDGSNYSGNPVDLEYKENTETTWSGETDVRIPFVINDIPGFLETGGKVLLRDKTVDAADVEYNYVGPASGPGSVTLSQFEAPSVQTVQVGNNLMPFANTERFANAFLSELCQPGDQRLSGDRSCNSGRGLYELNEEEVAQEDVENDSENEEQIYAGYAMTSFDFGSLTALAGARLEHTSTSSTRFQLTFPDGGGFRTASETFENSYTDILPSVHLTYEVDDNLQFRGAWSNTIGRPDYDDLASFEEIEVEGNEASVDKGNPDLDPFRAMNFDLGAEYYFENGGLAALTGFYKRINNPIFEFTETETGNNLTIDGESVTEIETTQERNADSGTVLGLEATYQQPFTFLPSPFDGLGVNSNVTVTESDIDLPGDVKDEQGRRDDLPFFQQADLVYNIAPYFQKGGFEARVAVNFRGDYLLALEDEPANDVWVKDRTTVDINTSYQFAGLLGKPELMFQVENATDAPEVEYAGGNEDRLNFHYLSGRTVTLGLSAQF